MPHKMMWIVFPIFIFLIISTKGDIVDCDYFDTVNLTNCQRFQNGSYLYERIVIPKQLTGEYDYEILADGERVNVSRHMRGCACKLGNCIRFCCQRNLMLVQDERKCSGDVREALEYDPLVEITMADGSQVRRHIHDEMIVQDDLPVPCAGHFHLDVNMPWALFEDGSMIFDNISIGKREYCLQPQRVRLSGDDYTIQLVPHLCEDPQPNRWPKTILLMLSIICLLVTLFVYIWLPKLRNLHGFCFMCYMICIGIVYMLLLADQWSWFESQSACNANGYFGYFFVIAGFLWLTVISYDMWRCFNDIGSNRYTSQYRFWLYSIYVWGTAAILTIIVIVADVSLDSSDPDMQAWMPGVGLYNCWVKTHDWSAMLYFYGPISIQIIFNITMFVLTALSIMKVMDDLQNVTGREQRQRKLNSHRQTYIRSYGLFLRLFVIMGVTWIFEIFSYLSQSHGVWETIFKVFDYINCGLGIIIFIMFVLKQSVLKLIANRLRGINSSDDDDEEEVVLQETSRNNTLRRDYIPSILN